MAEDSCIRLPVNVVVDIMHYMMSFSPFPAAAVQFNRPELFMRMHEYLKLHCGVVNDEAARLTLVSLGRDYRASSFPDALRVLNDLQEASVTLTSRILAPLFIITKRSNSLEHMEFALRKHKELCESEHFTHNTSYYIHLLNGMSKHGMIDEALRIINDFRNVGFSSVLATVCIDICSRSVDPASAFSMYKVLFTEESMLEPVIEVYSVLLYAVARLEGGMVQKYVSYICTEMARRRVVTEDPSFLNRLVISLFAVKSNEQGYDLYKSMKQRDIEIWPITSEALPPHIRELEAAPSVLGYDIVDQPPIPTTMKKGDVSKEAPVFTQRQPRVVKLKRTLKEQKEKADRQRRREADHKVKMYTAPPDIDASEIEGSKGPAKGYDIGAMLGLK
eukprot:TRINITY_DN1034_c0_g1_i2.p1 TRINITY_DN1034_c0_g1~~TRINITY_DN1034_c0_g1_i2.p1  ORF type:complete len:454 (+),score=154.29 TRINITY_DN1034_c0_g1_i2:195-1364(+)